MTFDTCVDILKALADPTRLRLMSLLEGMELSVNEITEVIGTGQSGVSRHLKILAENGIVDCRRDGLWSFYRTVREGSIRDIISPSLARLLECAETETDRKKGADLLAVRSQKMTGYFNSVARDWDSRRIELLGNFDLDSMILNLIGNGSVADIGCGNGALAGLLVKNGHHVIGVDSSPKMIETARKRSGENSLADFRIGECEHLPMREGEIDHALAVLVLHHITNPERAISECARVVRPGGSVIVADFDAHTFEHLREQHHDLRLGISKDEIVSWFDSAHLALREEKRFKLASGLTLVFYVALK